MTKSQISLIRRIKQWRKTAGSDLKVANWLLRLFEEECHLDELDSPPYPFEEGCHPHEFDLERSPPYNWICFISFDCIEKALKATMIAENILEESDRSHDIYSYIDCVARNLDGEFERLRRKLSDINKFYYKTRWPNEHKSTCTPGDHFTEKEANTFLQIAAELLRAVDKILLKFL